MAGRASKTIICPECGRVFGMAKPMFHHLVDKHGLERQRAHRIAHPNDIPAARRTPRRRLPPVVRPAREPDKDFHLIDDEDQF